MELHVVAIKGDNPKFWMFPIPSTRLQRMAEYLNYGKLALVFDLDETLFQVRIRCLRKSAPCLQQSHATSHVCAFGRRPAAGTYMSAPLLSSNANHSPRIFLGQAVTIESFGKRIAVARERLAAAGRSTDPAKIAAMEGARGPFSRAVRCAVVGTTRSCTSCSHPLRLVPQAISCGSSPTHTFSGCGSAPNSMPSSQSVAFPAPTAQRVRLNRSQTPSLPPLSRSLRQWMPSLSTARPSRRR